MVTSRNQQYINNYWAGLEPIRAGIFAGESGGDYDALFGYSNRAGGRFAGVKPSEMSIGDIAQFTAPSGEYGQWVKSQIGRVATPVGAYQGVGSTIRDWMNQENIDPSRKFDMNAQDQFGRWVLDNQGTGAWEGYRGPGDPNSIQTQASSPAGGAQGVMPFFSTQGGTILDIPEPEPEKSQFHPGMALASLGAAMSASAEGRSAAEDLAAIRDKYFGRRDQAAAEARKKQIAQATGNLFADHEDLKNYIAAGGDPSVAMQVLSQRNAMMHEQKLQESQQHWQSGENNLNRVQDAKQFDARLAYDEDSLALKEELANRGFDIDRDRLDATVQQNYATINQWEWDNEFKRDRALAEDRRWQADHELNLTDYEANRADKMRVMDAAQAQGEAAQELMAITYDKLGMTEASKRVMEMNPEAFQDPAMVSQFNDLVSKPFASKDQRTAAMKNWEYYNQMLAQAETPEEKAAAHEFFKSLDKSTTINMGDKENFEWAKADISSLLTDREGINTAAAAVDALNQMQLILAENPDLKTGKIWSVLQTPLDLLSSAGLITGGFKDDQDARYMLDQLNTKLATLIKTPGAISNYEQQSFKAANPGVATPTQEIAGAIEALKVNVQRARDRVAFIEQQTRGGGSTYSAAEAEWNRMMDQGDPRTSPRYLNLDTFSKDNAGAFPMRIGSVVWKGGEPLKITTAEQLERLRSYIQNEME